MSRVALIGENSIEYICALLDIWNNGDCAVLIDSQIPPHKAVEMMDEAEVERCYIETKFHHSIYECSGRAIQLIPYERDDTSAQFLPKDVYDKFKENYTREEAVVIYSSGTTGKSKGIILSHFAINTNADAIIDYMRPCANDCMYIVRNLTHSSTITGELLVALKTKTPVLIAPVIVPPRYVLNNIAQYGVTIIGVNPLLLSMYVTEYKVRAYDIDVLKKIYVSGSILGDKICDTAHKVFSKQEIYNVYGLSEAGPRVAAQRYDCCGRNSVGKCIKGVDVVIVDENGDILTIGERGIIHVNSPSIFSGYIIGQVKHKSLYNGWLNTGDIGYWDENDELHIVGRSDDLIIIGAHKIYPSEVERCVEAVSDIQECVVVPIQTKNEVYLCCIYVSGTPIQMDIRRALKTKLLNFEIPKLFLRVETLPKNQNGKIMASSIRERISKECAIMEIKQIKHSVLDNL